MSLFARRRITPDSRDGVAVTLTRVERDALAELAAALERIALTGDDGPDDLGGPLNQVRARLNPAAYEDPMDQLEYAELLGGNLTAERRNALATFTRTLEGGAVHNDRWRVRLNPDETNAWLAVVNDGRLVLGVLCGVADEDDWDEVYERQDHSAAMLGFLGVLQGELVDVLMQRLPPDPA